MGKSWFDAFAVARLTYAVADEKLRSPELAWQGRSVWSQHQKSIGLREADFAAGGVEPEHNDAVDRVCGQLGVLMFERIAAGAA